MKALVLESNGKLVYKEIPVSEVKEDECQIKIKSAEICHSDISRAFENGAYHYPLIMGYKFAGEVVECCRSFSAFHGGGVWLYFRCFHVLSEIHAGNRGGCIAVIMIITGHGVTGHLLSSWL